MKIPLALALLAASALTCSADILLLDFGNTTTTTPANSPYHIAANTTSFTSWNTINSTADVNSGLVYGSGAAATGISLNLGASATGLNNSSTNSSLNTILLATQPSSISALGGNTNTGVYGNTSIATDGVFHQSFGNTTLKTGSVGLQITGLPAGTYEIYFTGRNTSINYATAPGTEKITAYAGAGVAGQNFTFNSYTATGFLSFNGTSSFTSSWVETENYLRLTVSLLAGEALNIASSGFGSTAGNGDQRGFINSIEIVAVPEPSSYALMAGAGCGVAALRRRRRR